MLMLPTPQLRKAAEDAAKKAASRELPKGEGFVDRVKYYAFKAYYFTLDNMLVVGVSVCLGLIPLQQRRPRARRSQEQRPHQ